MIIQRKLQLPALAVVIVTALAAPERLRAQQTDSVIAGGRLYARTPLTVGEVIVDATLARGDSVMRRGRSVRTIAESSHAGGATYTLTTRGEGQGAGWYELVVRRDDLTPVRFAMRTNTDSAAVELAGTAVTGWIDTHNGGRKSAVTTLPAVPFMMMIQEEVLGRLPLRPGYTAALFGYHPITGTSWTTYRVAGEEQIEIDRQPRDVWRIERVGDTRYLRSWTIFIDKTTRRIVREQTKFVNGNETTSTYR